MLDVEGRPIQWLGRALQKAGNEILLRAGISGTWIDVGAHHGETTIRHANRNPGLKVYAFEPNLAAVAKLRARAPNFIVIPMAVSEEDGCADLHINAYEESSSLLPLSEDGVRSWKGGELLAVVSTVRVPTIRLDTFLDTFGIATVDYLKVDAQGADLAVLRSAGRRIRDIRKIVVEVSVTPKSVYEGAASKSEVVSHLIESGFCLAGAETQTFGQEENLTFFRSSDELSPGPKRSPR